MTIKYRALCALTKFFDAALKYLSAMATKAAVKASAAETTAKRVRSDANIDKLNAAAVAARRATEALSKQQAEFHAELAAINDAHPLV